MRFQTVEDIYAAIPKIDCKKKCATSCTMIPITKLELHRLERANTALRVVDFGVSNETVMLQPNEMGNCNLLRFRECTAYELRPLICRLFGVAEGIKCKYGCIPERYLTFDEVAEMVMRMDELSAQHSKRRKE